MIDILSLDVINQNFQTISLKIYKNWNL